MAVPLLDPQRETSDRLPLLMDRSVTQASRSSEQSGTSPEIHDRQEHIIDIARGPGLMSFTVSHRNDHNHDQPSGSGQQQLPTSQPSASSTAAATATTTTTTAPSNAARNGRYARRGGDAYGRRHRSPLNSGLWISVELAVNLSQIVAAVVVLSVSRREKPQTPLFEWIVGYTVGCAAAIPHLYWRYTHRNSQSADRDPGAAQSANPSSNNLDILYAPAAVSEGRSGAPTASQTDQNAITNQRINSIVDHFKMGLDCFFAVWFVVGNVWIFGGRSSATDAPNLYRLCIVFLTFSCIGYAMPFILCATICCCLPCIISILGLREDLGPNRGAAADVINALPTYKFKLKKIRKRDGGGNTADDLGEGGIVAAGTNNERMVSAEDAVCCICLAKYADNDKLRELPCTHFFHMECVDKWLKINALCPLCKLEIGETNRSSPVTSSSGNRG